MAYIRHVPLVGDQLTASCVPITTSQVGGFPIHRERHQRLDLLGIKCRGKFPASLHVERFYHGVGVFGCQHSARRAQPVPVLVCIPC